MPKLLSLALLIALAVGLCGFGQDQTIHASFPKASGGGGGTWTQVQNKICTSDGVGSCGTCTAGTTTCIVTATSVAASDKIVIWGGYVNGSSLTVTYSGETWTNPSPTCANWDASGTGFACSYVLIATGGETSFTCTFSSAPSFSSCGFIQLHYTGASATFDTAGVKSDTACTSCAGVTLTLSGSNDAIATYGIPDHSFTAITAPYATNAIFVDGLAASASLGTASGTAPTLTQSASGNGFIGAVALKGN